LPQLPSSLRPLFWEYDFSRLRWRRDADLILDRVLSQGGSAQLRLVRRRFGDEGIRDWILRHEARGLSPQQIRFWELVLKLPRAKADAWVRAARSGTWHRRSAP
jgi:hypothetical protein